MFNTINQTKTVLPSEDVIKRHVEYFKDKFVERFNQKWSTYRNDVRRLKMMKSQPVAYSSRKMAENTKHDASDGLTDETELENVSSNVSKNTLRRQDSLVDSIRVRLRSHKNRRLVQSFYSLEESLLNTVIAETASELAVSFEYQLAMLFDETEVEKVSKYAIDSILAYLRSRNASFDSQSVYSAVLDIVPDLSFIRFPKLKTRIILNGFLHRTHLEWDVYSFFQKPGLRISADNEQEEGTEYKFFERFCPWGTECITEIYGYRKPVYFKHMSSKESEMIFIDRASIEKYNAFVKDNDINGPSEISASSKFHTNYKPIYS